MENGNYRDYRVYIGVYIRGILGLYRDNGKENGNYCSIDYIGIGEKKMETTVVYWGYIGNTVFTISFVQP